jgi:serine/threonine protein kinase
MQLYVVVATKLCIYFMLEYMHDGELFVRVA